MNEQKRQLLDLHQREAEIHYEHLQYIKNQERFRKGKQEELLQQLNFHTLQLQQIQNHLDNTSQRTR
jgi:hypothetical protein